MIFLSSVLYYYFIKTTHVKELDIKVNLQYKNNYKDKIIDTILDTILDVKTKKHNTKKQITKIIPEHIDILDINILHNNNLYYEYNGYRFLANFPKKWLETIDKYDNIGLNCSNCLYYCCLEEYGELPLFLGFCKNCCRDFINPDDDCNDCNYYINNIIDYSNEISDVIINNKGNTKMLQTLIKKLNDEYKNIDAL